MKKNKILLLFATILLLISCEKDENGYHITYYKNKIAIGYVFYGKYETDSIWPAKCNRVEIESIYSIEGELFGYSKIHKDIVYTDECGKYSFNFVKTIDGKKVLAYDIYAIENMRGVYHNSIKIMNEDISKAKIYYNDSLILYINDYD
ncbi:MAG: hypothetical protein LBI45_00450 [Bacteroidales bacterium]|jgi:hypothetical protein|nr:hypothetical protein [Bacteroidales bacterium]